MTRPQIHAFVQHHPLSTVQPIVANVLLSLATKRVAVSAPLLNIMITIGHSTTALAHLLCFLIPKASVGVPMEHIMKAR